MMDHAPELDLDTRTGWPADLQALLARHPRASWYPETARAEHPGLGEMPRFWLARHDMFRSLGGALGQALETFRAGGAQPAAFRGWFAPRLGFFLRELETHHHIEDHHYFPVFAAAEPRLAHGFETLDADHHRIHESLLAAARSGQAFLDALARDADAQRRAGDAYAAEAEALLTRLIRHLEDEEDLVVPLLIEKPDAVPHG